MVRSLLRGLAGGAAQAAPAAAEAPLVIAHDRDSRLAILDDFEQAGIGWIWASDAAGRLIYVSQSAADHLGQPIGELLGKPLVALFEADAENPDERSGRPLKFQLSARAKITDLTVRLASAGMNDGRQLWWSISGHPKLGADGAFLGYRGSAKDVTLEYQRKLEDSRLAEYDSLTGLANRHRMNRRLDSILAAYKSAKRSCALIMMDLDRFKQVNDTLGHQAGDDLLRQVGERLTAIVGHSGEIGRLGGDEFQIIVPDVDDRGKLGELAGKLIQIVSQPYQIGGKRAVIGTSVGVAVAPYDGMGRNELERAADLALYSAKNGGRGQYRFYSAGLKDEAQERELLLDDLREALANDQLALHYQPVVRVADNMVVGFEALMRWDHPDRGSVSPSLFIPIAEESGLILQLGEWALRQACEDAMRWPGALHVAVNVSAKQFCNNGFPALVANALAHSGLAPKRLELELTETVLMGDSEATDEIFKVLKGIGVRLALDDFGTGYSSLSYLRSAPIDKIKVDKSFVDSCTEQGQNSCKIITAIIGLSDALGMETVVEGVEAFDQFDLVREKGAKLIQGWIYSKALPHPDIVERMATGEFKIEPEGPARHRADRRSVFRRIGVIHDDHRYEAVMRNLSKSGAEIEGLLGVPVGTGLVVDLGAGQLAVGSVSRAEGATIAVEFETALVSDGAGGLVTRHRVSPYALAAAGMPLASLSQGTHPMGAHGVRTAPQFMEVSVSRG